jgi:hypothetical protein
MSASKVLGIFCLALILLLTATGTGFAQDGQPPKPPDVPLEPPFPPGKFPFGADQLGWENQNPLQAESGLSAQALTLGAVGLSFSYAQTIGTTETPYISDTTHLNHPWGITMVFGTTPYLLVSEYFGHRVLKCTLAGVCSDFIGRAGISYNDGEPWGAFATSLDSGGNTWLADNSGTVMKYDSSGTFLSYFHQNDGTFSNPSGIAFDSSNNLYVSDGGAFWSDDQGRQQVLIFNTTTGDLIGSIGSENTPGTGNLDLHGPQHIYVDNHYLYVADAGNQRVQIYDIANPAVPVYYATLGTTNESGWNNSHFDHPTGVVVKSSYIYVADRWNNRIQIFDKTSLGWVATIGTGSSGAGNDAFNSPTDVAVDDSGNLYVADFQNLRVQKFDSSRNYALTYGVTGVPYLTTDGLYNSPSDVAVASDGSMYITEDNGQRLIKLNADGTTAWAVGAPGIKFPDWPTPTNRLNNPADIAISSTGKIYFADRWNNRILVYNPNGTYSATLGGSSGTNDNFVFQCPTGLAIDKSGYIYVTDCWRNRVQIYNSAHGYVGTLGTTDTPGADDTHFNDPEGVAVDSNGFIYVADDGNHRIQVFNSSRVLVRTMGDAAIGGGTCRGRFECFNYPTRLAVDSSNRLYVADTNNQRIQVFDASGGYLTSVGGNWGSESGKLRGPQGLGIGPNGELYVADWGNHRIQKFTVGTPNWEQTTLNGFGERATSMASMTPFKGQLYAGTYNYAQKGAQIWRSSDGKNWTEVVSDGFGVLYNIGIDHMIEFNGKLYAGTWNSTPSSPYTDTGGEIWRSSDGVTWEPVVQGGFDNAANNGIMRMAVFNGKLYAGTWTYSTTHTHGAEIWRSDTGDAGTWTKVVNNGLGDSANDIVMSMETFNGYLYAGTHNWDYTISDTTGSKIWRTADGVTWTEVVGNGFGNLNSYFISLAAFGDSLYYAGVGSWLPSGQPVGGQVWKCTAASGCDTVSDWTQVTINGFGNPQNDTMASMRVFANRLYLTTVNATTGMEVWQTDDGADWQKVGGKGFGDSNNDGTYWDNSMTVFNNHLFIGTTNGANGGEIWSNTFSLPGAFNKASPLDGAASQPLSLFLKWNASNSATSYEVCFDDNNNNKCDTAWNSVGNTHSKEIRGLEYGKTYYWQVRAKNDFADTYANDNVWRSFTTGTKWTTSISSSPANDGWTLESSEFSNTASTRSNLGTLRVGDDALRKQYRSLLYFNTSIISDNAVVSSVVLKIKKAGTTTGSVLLLGDLVADMKSGAFGLAPLELTDFNAAGAPINTAGSFSESSGTYQLTLSPANFKYVNLAGITQFRIRFTKDDDNDKTADFLSFYAGEDAVNAPQLIVEYTIP